MVVIYLSPFLYFFAKTNILGVEPYRFRHVVRI